MGKIISLEDILGRNQEELTALKRGTFTAEKLGTVAFCEIDQPEYKTIKKDCMKMVPDPKGGRGAMTPELDDDKLMLKLVVAAVDKESKQPDARSNFTFANKQLLEKLGVVAADQAAAKLLSIGEIYQAAMGIQEVCGFTDKAQEEEAEEIKN
jgi:hypothetical protein